MRRFMQWIMVPLVLMLLLPGMAEAHTKLTSSVPENGATVSEDLLEVKILFNTTIEPVSTLQITNQNDEVVNGVELEVGKDNIVAKLAEPLANGAYKVDWRIVGQDGHPIQDGIRFTVDNPSQSEAPATEQQPAEEKPAASEPAAQEESHASTENGAADPMEQHAEVNEPASEHNKTANSTLLYIIITAILVVLLIILLLPRKKK